MIHATSIPHPTSNRTPARPTECAEFHSGRVRGNRSGDHPAMVTELLDEHDVARITGMSVASVRRWRLRRVGPKYLKIGAAVRYRPDDVAAWIDSRPAGGGETAPRTEGAR